MSCGCPPPYFLNTTTGLCDKVIIEVAGVSAVSPVPPLLCPDPSYMASGTALMPVITPAQFPLIALPDAIPKYTDHSGTTITPHVTLVSGLWIGGNSDSGRMNQVGIGLNPPVRTWQGYGFCIEVKAGDIYWVGMASTFGFRLFIDQTLAVVNQPLFPVTAADYFHVFPIQLSVGKHSFIVEGMSGYFIDVPPCLDNLEGPVPCTSNYAVTPVDLCPNLGNLVFEVYKNVTPQILASAMEQAGLNAIYAQKCVNGEDQYITTSILRGPTDTGINGVYSCQESHLNSCRDNVPTCNSIDSIPQGTCCFTLTNCTTGSILTSNTNLTTYQDKIVKLLGHSGCYAIATASDCSSSTPVTVTAYFDSCQVCTRVYYRLVDCRGEQSPIVTYTDLSLHISKVIKIRNSSACWIVGLSDIQAGIEIDLVSSFNTCEEC